MQFLCAPATAQGAGGYEPYSGIIRGTEGAQPVTLRIRNDGAADLACTAALAHWYSQALGRAAPGAALDVALWHDPQTGVLNLLNAQGDRMPVEAVWCRPAGTGRAARGRVGLPLAAGPAPARIARACAPAEGGGRIACRPLAE